MENEMIIQNNIESKILSLRGKQVMIDRDLAELYGVETKRLNEQVKRNIERFPAEFCFQLTATEKAELVANCDRFNPLKHSTTEPYAFTEHGVTMLAAVLKSETKEKERRERNDLHRPKNKTDLARRTKVQCAISDDDREAHDKNARPFFDN